jgi:hypothetical protein
VKVCGGGPRKDSQSAAITAAAAINSPSASQRRFVIFLI